MTNKLNDFHQMTLEEVEDEYVYHGKFIAAEEYNELFDKGYHYYVEGDWEASESIEPWSGMPYVDGNIHFFINKADAEAYAARQTWVFNRDIHGEVKEMTTKWKTDAELAAEREKEKNIKRKKKLEKEVKKLQAELTKLQAELDEINTKLADN